MPAPKNLVEVDGPGYYWAQIYLEATDELMDPLIVQLFHDKGKMQVAFLGLEQPFVVPMKWVWLVKLSPPERLEVDLG